MEDARCSVRVQSDTSPEFQTRRGLRQGDALACLLFNLALEKVVRSSGIQTTGTIYNRLVQILGYADDIDIVARSYSALKEAFLQLMEAADDMGLTINESKTKYMKVSRAAGNNAGPPVVMGPYSFESVSQFTYLGSVVSSTNRVSLEVSQRIVKANRCYFGLRRHLRSSDLTRQTKCLLYKTLIRPVLTYGSETWTLTSSEEKEVAVFERKILRRIFGAVREGDHWRRRYNREVYELFGEPDITRIIKLGRLRWAGHVARMPDGEVPRKLLEEVLDRPRSRGRPRLRWEDAVVKDARTLLNTRNWRAAAQDRANWRKLLEEAMVHPGL